MAKKLSKDEIKGPDAFVATTDRIIEKLNEYKSIVFIVLGIAFLAGATKVGIDLVDSAKESKAQTKLFHFQNQVVKIRQDLNKTGIEEKSAQAFDKHYGSVAGEWKAAIGGLKNTVAAQASAIELAFFAGEFKKPEMAKEVLLSVASEVKPDQFLYGLVLNQLGTVYSTLGDCNSSIGYFDKVLSAQGQGHIFPDVLLNKSVCLGVLGKTDESRSLLERIKDEYSETNAARSATSYLRLLMIKKTKN